MIHVNPRKRTLSKTSYDYIVGNVIWNWENHNWINYYVFHIINNSRLVIRCWWRMLETKFVSDHNIMVTVLVTNIHYPFKSKSGTNIQKMSPTCINRHKLSVTKITVTIMIGNWKGLLWRTVRGRFVESVWNYF